jgi:capsular polysaccharide biosynthesis protein
MNQQPLNLRRSVDIMLRYKALVGIFAALGFIAGAGYTFLYPPTLTSTTLVVVPQAKPDLETQMLIASSNPVLSGALPSLGRTVSLNMLRNKIHVASVNLDVISISADDTTAALAEKDANTVAASYIAYIGSTSNPVGQVSAHVLFPATSATGNSPLKNALVYGIIGGIAGLLAGFCIALGKTRQDRLLRTRDEIANSIGVPVLAAVPVDYPADAAGWIRLLDSYEPGAVQSWRLRRSLERLGASGPGKGNGGCAIVVLSLSSDRKASALGPQLAVFASSLGIPTSLVVGPQQDPDAAAELRAACTARSSSSPRRHPRLSTIVTEDTGFDLPEQLGYLTVVIVTVNGDSPQVPRALGATTTVIGVSARVATAEQLSRAAAAVIDVGGNIVGIIVANPEPGDNTTGLDPHLGKLVQRSLPTRSTVETEIRT